MVSFIILKDLRPIERIGERMRPFGGHSWTSCGFIGESPRVTLLDQVFGFG